MIADLPPGTWLTVANYALTFALCLYAAFRSGRFGQAWTVVACCLFALLINKVCGLETRVAEAARSLAKADGIYAIRRLYQAAALAGMLALFPYALRSAWRQLAHQYFPLQLAAACTTALATFIAARSLSFHYLDKLLALGPGFIKLNGLIENAIVCGILTSAVLALRFHGPRRRLQPLRS